MRFKATRAQDNTQTANPTNCTSAQTNKARVDPGSRSHLDWIGRPFSSPCVRECQQQVWVTPWLLCPLVAQGRICGIMALLLLTSFVGDVEGQSVTRPEAAPPTRGKSIRVMGVQPDWLPIVQSAARYTAMLCSNSLTRDITNSSSRKLQSEHS